MLSVSSGQSQSIILATKYDSTRRDVVHLLPPQSEAFLGESLAALQDWLSWPDFLPSPVDLLWSLIFFSLPYFILYNDFWWLNICHGTFQIVKIKMVKVWAFSWWRFELPDRNVSPDLTCRSQLSPPVSPCLSCLRSVRPSHRLAGIIS